MLKSILTIALLLTSLSSFSYPRTPNLQIAPGHLCQKRDKDFDRLRYKEKIPYCRRNVSKKRKDAICAKYGVFDRANYTVDHIIPLSMGGSNHNKNLWCQHRKIYTGELEFWLYRNLELGRMRQAETLLSILSHKYNPRGKDRLPRVPSILVSQEEPSL